MIYNKERHKQLVIRSQDLKNQGKNFFLENPEEDSELSKYNIGVEEQVFWTHRENFVLIMKNFLDNILNFDEFETAFSLLYKEVEDKYCTEQEVKDYVKEVYLKKFLNEE